MSATPDLVIRNGTVIDGTGSADERWIVETVRGFADKAVIGEAVSDTSGNFVIEGEMKLEVGNHIIEVELLYATGKVVVRASVPFERPAGEHAAERRPDTTRLVMEQPHLAQHQLSRSAGQARYALLCPGDTHQ